MSEGPDNPQSSQTYLLNKTAGLFWCWLPGNRAVLAANGCCVQEMSSNVWLNKWLQCQKIWILRSHNGVLFYCFTETREDARHFDRWVTVQTALTRHDKDTWYLEKPSEADRWRVGPPCSRRIIRLGSVDFRGRVKSLPCLPSSKLEVAAVRVMWGHDGNKITKRRFCSHFVAWISE